MTWDILAMEQATLSLNPLERPYVLHSSMDFENLNVCLNVLNCHPPFSPLIVIVLVLKKKQVGAP